MSLEDLRRQYTMGGLNLNELPQEPISLFSDWMQTALQQAPYEWVEPYAMTLATSDLNGSVTARIVLLRGFDEAGFVFYSNYGSAKGKQLAVNGDAALVFYWGYLERQVRVNGVVSKVSREQSEAYFKKRPRGSQISASVSRQSEDVESREQLEGQVRAFEAELGDSNVPLPDDWGGYLVKPLEIEFWQGRQNRLHDRIVYRCDELNGWSRRRIAP